MTETVLGLLRHGQTDWNVNFLLQGVTDIPMNQVGVEQIRTASQAIRPSDWDLIVSSPLGRAKHSAEIINEVLGFHSVIEHELLIERSFGEAEGLSYEQWREKYGSLDVIPGGESRSDLESRSLTLLETFRTEFQGKRVLAVSHGALIRTLIAIASKRELPKDGERLENASLNVVRHFNSNWEIVNYQLEALRP